MQKLEIKLKQHTPLIHFQHDQDGATLRASEVKPKLDKFIINSLIHKLGDDNYESISDQKYEELIAIYEKEYYPKKFDDLNANRQAYEIGRLIAYEKGMIKKTANRPALDYRLIIIPNQIIDGIKLKEEPDEEKTDPLTGKPIYETPAYPSPKNVIVLGNIGGKPKDELLNFTQHESVDLMIVSKHPEIVEQIKTNVQQFFLQNNFQNRKYRGFGSFTVMSIDGEPVTSQSTPQNMLATLSFDISNETGFSKWTGTKMVFDIIGKVWSTLRNNSNNNEIRGIKKVFLGVENKLSNEEERIPSPIYFKPIIEKLSNKCWKATIYILSNKIVIKAGDCTEKDFLNLIKRNARFIKIKVDNCSRDSLTINNIDIKTR